MSNRNKLFSADNALFCVLIAAFFAWTVGSVAVAAVTAPAADSGTCAMVKGAAGIRHG
jgi:hypothetical protein